MPGLSVMEYLGLWMLRQLSVDLTCGLENWRTCVRHVCCTSGEAGDRCTRLGTTTLVVLGLRTGMGASASSVTSMAQNSCFNCAKQCKLAQMCLTRRPLSSHKPQANTHTAAVASKHTHCCCGIQTHTLRYYIRTHSAAIISDHTVLLLYPNTQCCAIMSENTVLLWQLLYTVYVRI